ncbi:Rad10p [Sugiyamaella lignohabitans]|uniref:Rad10p n=1 Tax=Sugiyamaella lignohabitans TaxID=796027 RepID=A0A161HIK4_9ASCO|nr:Rad10p [Sugiyamaella lignohabitans]ANB10988.1 Rad10p [Sugiyamaella lignohabitans]
MEADRTAAILKAAAALRGKSGNNNGSSNSNGASSGSAPPSNQATPGGSNSNSAPAPPLATSTVARTGIQISGTNIPILNSRQTGASATSTSYSSGSSTAANGSGSGPSKRSYGASSVPGPSGHYRAANSGMSTYSRASPTTSSSLPTNTTSASSATPGSTSTAKANTTSSIIVNAKKQKQNPVLKHIRGVGYYMDDIVPDFITGHNSCALFLSIKYHNIHKEYIYKRIQQLNKAFEHRVLLVLVDVDNPAAALLELDIISLRAGLQMIITWNMEEAGKYLVLLKQLENASATGISGQKKESYKEQLIEVMNRISRSSINKTDAVTLVANFGSLKNAILDGGDNVELIHGWGSTKAKVFRDAINEPFINHRQYDMKPYKSESQVDSELP